MGDLAAAGTAEIIKAAAISPLGLAALLALIGVFVVIKLIDSKDAPHLRMGAILSLLGFCGLLMGAAVYRAEVTESAEDDTPGVSNPQPPPGPRPFPPGPLTKGVVGDSLLRLSRPELPLSCGGHWTIWVPRGRRAADPCPDEYASGAELRVQTRVSGFPPQIESRREVQCWRGGGGR